MTEGDVQNVYWVKSFVICIKCAYYVDIVVHNLMYKVCICGYKVIRYLMYVENVHNYVDIKSFVI